MLLAEAAEAPVAAGTSAGALISALTIFSLAVIVGVEVITKIPPTLHTPLMSGANAISGITILGAMTMAASVGDS
ncbi:MAG: proton-translocating transhydrogenase family protein, partial [Maioricimonas sp. JB045]